jgi:hypothetical protein
MSETNDRPRLLPPMAYSRWAASEPGLWQMSLLSARELADFCRERGLERFHWGQTIKWLWQIGLLHADLVVSKRRLRRPGLHWLASPEEDRHLYADERSQDFAPDKWRHAARKLLVFPEKKGLDVEICFHPFRYYVVYHLGRGLPSDNVVKNIVEIAEASEAVETYKTLAAEYNDLAALAIAAEPFTHGHIFGRVRLPFGEDRMSYLAKLSTYKAAILPHFQVISRERIDELRAKVCMDAEAIDPNSSLHTLLRLADGRFRLGLKGDIAGSLHLLSIAETLRRAYEEAHEIELPEEDERMYSNTFSPVLADSKRTLYGSSRLLEADRTVANEYIRRKGLDYSVRLRWYVEGPTEQGAVLYLLKELQGNEGRTRETGIDVVDLAGLVTQNQGKFLAFQDTLSADLEAGVFSFISIDYDVADNRRSVRQAVLEDLVCGRVFYSTPDFEFGNFDLDEFEEILWSVAEGKGADPSKRSILAAAIAGVQSGKVLEKVVKGLGRREGGIPELGDIKKSKDWGELLAKYILEHPDRRSTGKHRPILEATSAAIESSWRDYKATRSQIRLDPDNFETLWRDQQYKVGQRGQIRQDIYLTFASVSMGEPIVWLGSLENGKDESFSVSLHASKSDVKDDKGRVYRVEIEDEAVVCRVLGPHMSRSIVVKAYGDGVPISSEVTEFTLTISELAGPDTRRSFTYRLA